MRWIVKYRCYKYWQSTAVGPKLLRASCSQSIDAPTIANPPLATQVNALDNSQPVFATSLAKPTQQSIIITIIHGPQLTLINGERLHPSQFHIWHGLAAPPHDDFKTQGRASI